MSQAHTPVPWHRMQENRLEWLPRRPRDLARPVPLQPVHLLSQVCITLCTISDQPVGRGVCLAGLPIMGALSHSWARFQLLQGCQGHMPLTTVKAWLGYGCVQGPQPKLPPHLAALGLRVAGSILLCASLHRGVRLSARRANWGHRSWKLIDTGCMLI